MSINNTKPVWRNIPHEQAFDTLTEDIHVDVAVIGAGITGITAACLLTEAGKKVAVLDLGQVGHGTTGANSGHLSSMVDTYYHKIESQLGEESARKVAQSVQEAQRFVQDYSLKYNIDCDFSWVDGYMFTQQQKDTHILTDEMMAMRKAGLNIIAEKPVLPFAIAGGFGVERQAQFHPLKHILGLAQAIHAAGCRIFENTIVRRVEEGDTCLLETDKARVHAGKVIMATHMPISVHPVQGEVYPYISYCIAVRTSYASQLNGLYYDTEDPYHYIRSYADADGQLLIIGGCDHKTGHEEDAVSRFTELEQYARQHFGDIEVAYRWSGQYYKPADGLPFIGYSAFSDHTLIGTGYSGDGLSWGTVAGRLLADLVLERENPYTQLYSATRLNLMASAREIIMENVDAVKHLIFDRFTEREGRDLKQLQNGQGKIMNISGKKLAVYRDEAGKYYAMSPVCHHLGCYVHWNNAERSWDCPCHGSRFDGKGKVIYGPVLHDLTAKEIDFNHS